MGYQSTYVRSSWFFSILLAWLVCVVDVVVLRRPLFFFSPCLPCLFFFFTVEAVRFRL